MIAILLCLMVVTLASIIGLIIFLFILDANIETRAHCTDRRLQGIECKLAEVLITLENQGSPGLTEAQEGQLAEDLHASSSTLKDSVSENQPKGE